jgi:hypothetical protein
MTTRGVPEDDACPRVERERLPWLCPSTPRPAARRPPREPGALSDETSRNGEGQPSSSLSATGTTESFDLRIAAIQGRARRNRRRESC